MVAGVVFAPTLVLLALVVAPFVDRNPSTKPSDRKLAITLFTMLMMFGATLAHRVVLPRHRLQLGLAVGPGVFFDL